MKKVFLTVLLLSLCCSCTLLMNENSSILSFSFSQSMNEKALDPDTKGDITLPPNLTVKITTENGRFQKIVKAPSTSPIKITKLKPGNYEVLVRGFTESETFHGKTNVTIEQNKEITAKIKLNRYNNTYFVNKTSGNDINKGTETNPFQTISKAIDTITSLSYSNDILDEQETYTIKIIGDSTDFIETSPLEITTPIKLKIQPQSSALISNQSSEILIINNKKAFVSCDTITFQGLNQLPPKDLINIKAGTLEIINSCNIQLEKEVTNAINIFGIHIFDRGNLIIKGDVSSNNSYHHINLPILLENNAYITPDFSYHADVSAFNIRLSNNFNTNNKVLRPESPNTELNQEQIDAFEIVSNDGFVRFINTEGVVEVYNSVTSAIELVNNAGSAPKNIRVAVMPEDTGETPETSKYIQLKSAITADKNIKLTLYDPYLNVKGDFSGMPGLKELVIENCDGWVSSFAGCTKLEAVTIPEKYDSIYANAFDGCNNLQRVTIGTAPDKMWQVDNDGIAIIIDVSNPITNKDDLLGQYKAYKWTQKNPNIM